MTFMNKINQKEQRIWEGIRKRVKELYKLHEAERVFVPGKSEVSVGGKVYDENELINGVEAILDEWWTEGRFAKEFEERFSRFLGVPFVTLSNSGSSANLIAISALTSRSLGKRALRKGDEVITAAMGFPTTLNPIIQQGCIPVLVDIDIKTGNIDTAKIEKAISSKTRALMIAHTFGNPVDLGTVLKIARKYNLWLIEDCCDSLGSIYKNKFVGTFGDIATFSFYAAHHMTMGEGGALITKNQDLHKAIRQFRNWGSECLCDAGKKNVCSDVMMKSSKYKNLPREYYHRYIFSQIGFNLRVTDMQAAIGVAQLKKLPSFLKKRENNFNSFYSFFKKYEKYFIPPTWEKDAKPSWFGYLVNIKESAPFRALDMVNFLEGSKIATRSPMAGNLLSHPAYENIKYRKVGNFNNSDKIMHNSFWIGIYPGIDRPKLNYVLKKIKEFLTIYEKKN